MNILEKIAIFGLADDTNSRRSRDMKEVTTGRSSGSIWHRVSSLWDTLGLSVILGLIMMFVGSIGVNADFNQELGPLIWAVIICLGVAYEKVASKGNAAKTAGAGAASAAIAATIMNLKGVETPDLILAVRFIFYPFLAWTVVTLERLHLASLASAWKYLAPLVLLPGNRGGAGRRVVEGGRRGGLCGWLCHDLAREESARPSKPRRRSRSQRPKHDAVESGKNSGVLCGSEQRRGWLKDRVEGQRRQVGLVPEPLS